MSGPCLRRSSPRSLASLWGSGRPHRMPRSPSRLRLLPRSKARPPRHRQRRNPAPEEREPEPTPDEGQPVGGELPAHDEAPPPGGSVVQPEPEPKPEPEPEPEPEPKPEPEPPPPSIEPPPAVTPAPHKKKSDWRVWGSPLASVFIPGLGQFFNHQGGKGTGLLFATVGSAGIAAALYTLPNDGTRSNGAEYARLVSFGVFSTAAPLLWIYSIADAYRVAAKKELNPKVDHKVRISATRMMTVGFRADPARPGFYDDLSVSVMGQATKRFSIGVSDLSIKSGGLGGPQVWQFGLRFDYRVVERNRLWLDLGAGSLFQVASGLGAAPLDPDAAIPPRELRFAAVPYGQLDLRIFVLDRLSLDLVPRLAVPVTTRYYSAQRALPRYAPTLELGAGVSAYF